MTLVAQLQDFAAAVGGDIKRLSRPASPVFSYTGGVLTSIAYPGGATKTFGYTSGQLTQLDSTHAGVTTRKTFNYAGGTLASIAEVTL